MVNPDFNKLKNLSSSKVAKESAVAWREFLLANFNFVNHCSYQVKEDHIGEITKSLQNWITRRDKKDYIIKDASNKWVTGIINLGDIFIVDMGLSYETGYAHPVVVIEYIGEKLLVVPVTSSNDKLHIAYHPTANPTGDKMFRKVYKSDGFDSDCVLMLNSLNVINKGRLIEHKGTLNEDIKKPNSIFNEIRMYIIQMYFGDFYSDYQNLVQENEQFRQRIKELEVK